MIRTLLALILLLYLALAALFAVYTPAWQAPDEPAHYNYVRYLAENGRFPILQPGDYPHAYLEELKAQRFPPALSIAFIRYEFHQPPLYYALIAPFYLLFGGALLPLRLFSVLLGAGIVLLAYGVARRACPTRPGLALGTAAFVAFLPQHLTTVSQVGNDVLAELLFAAVLYVLVGWVGVGQSPIANRQSPIALAVLLGLILITKTTTYVAVPLVGGVLLWQWWRQRAGARRALAGLALVTGPVALLALPWYARNLWIYGWPDFLGLIRHDAIVIGQPRTAAWLAQYGWGGYLGRLVEFTFKSFWGVFGWLGVFMDSRVYFALAILSGVVAGGVVFRISDLGFGIGDLGQRAPSKIPERGQFRAWQMAAGKERSTLHAPRSTFYAVCLLATSTLLTLLVYAWYNAQFVQHQGRYLFTALIPIAIAFGAGWEAALRPRVGRWLAGGLALCALGLAAWGLASGAGLPKWPLAITLIAAIGLAIWDLGFGIWDRGPRNVPVRLRISGPEFRIAKSAVRNLQSAICNLQSAISFALPYVALPLLALYALFGAIVPQLAR
jgi:4-amino-4-deoxy-L-arabinose transferase-like glycosyltransferase